MYRILLFPLLLGALCLKVNAQDFNYSLSDDSLVNHYASKNRVYNATRVEKAPKIDGRLDDACWKMVGEWHGDFIQQQPHEAKEPSQLTEVKILYDDKYLYCGIIAYDNEPQNMSPILGRRDDYTAGDIAGIAIDSYNDNKTAFQFDITAAGQKLDYQHLEDYSWDLNWNAVWDGKTSLGDSAWYAEMRIPFSQIRFPDKEEQVWGLQIWRYVYRLAEESQWKLVPIDAPAAVYIFGELRGIKDIKNKRNFEVMPYSKAQYIKNSNDDQRFGVGVDGKIGVSSNFTLDYTFNPDFGQVEADPSVLNLSSYEVFYDEKRPFFLEGNNVLEYNSGSDRLFYSRRIGHAPSYTPGVDEDEGESLSMPNNTSILNALKLTGKTKNGLSIGVLNSLTSAEDAVVSSEKTRKEFKVEPYTNYSLARVKQDFNNGSSHIGGIVTSTIRNIKNKELEFLADNALVGGFDFEHNWKKRKYYVAGKTFFSDVNGSEQAIKKLQRNSRHYFQRPDASHLDYDPTRTSLSGWGGQLRGGKRSGKLRITGDLTWRSPGVELNDLGYLRQADYIDQEVKVEYRFNRPKGIYLSYLFRLTQSHKWTYGGDNLTDDLNAYFRMRFKNYWKYDLVLDRRLKNIDTRELRGGPALRKDAKNGLRTMLQTNPQKNLFFAFGAEYDIYDDDITREDEYIFQANWQVNNRFVLSSRSVWNKLKDNSQYIGGRTIDGKKHYLVGLLDRKTFYTTFRAEFFVTPELSLQYYGSPYVSSGRYLDYRRVADAGATDLNDRYEFLTRENGTLTDQNSQVYHYFSNFDFDFDFREFRSNFVARWEYKTGSTIYFVWTHNRSSYTDVYSPSLMDSLKGIRKVTAENAFMVKLSYWFSL